MADKMINNSVDGILPWAYCAQGKLNCLKSILLSEVLDSGETLL